MTQPHRSWLLRFSDPKALSDLRAAAESCMRSLCECDPAECSHPDNRMSPAEFVDWLEREVHRSGRTAHPTQMVRELNRAGARRTPRQLQTVGA